jgi:hypothetical protein
VLRARERIVNFAVLEVVAVAQGGHPMLRKTMTVLAMAAALAAGLTADAAARATAHSGWDGLGDGGAHAMS